MQTVRYYRDYAARARRLNQGVDRRAIREALETLAAGFDEIARELETGMVSALHPHDSPHSCSECQAKAAAQAAAEGPARFLSPTRH